MDDEKLSLMPFEREKLSLTRFLGSGAFGEVFEGKAKDIISPATVTLVAVKVTQPILILFGGEF